jgi:polyferredoxin
MKKIFSLNAMSRIIFLLLTPIFFQYFGLGFIWHSIYWGVITSVVIIWSAFILISPLAGRIGCGWFCFMGTASDLSSQHAIFKTKWKKPKIWVRALILIPFFASATAFYFINAGRGITHGFAVIPSFLKLDFGPHYQLVWAIDVMSALIFGLLLDRRWACKNLCLMGALCSAGANYSRLIPVVDTSKCTLCGKCEKDCLVRIPMLHYIQNNRGLITNSECILCGKCVEVCKVDAIKIRFVWNRTAFKNAPKGLLGLYQQR